jgi:starch-binding outer membrane protein, SusD/RagB family
MKLRYFGLFAAALVAACDGPLDVDPQQSLPQERALQTPDEVRVATNAMYDALQACDGGYCRNLVVFPDLYADNLAFTGTFTSDRQVGSRDVRPENTALPGMWGAAYSGINRANNVLQALPNVSGITAAEAAVIEGEARFIRALNYFTLVKFWGGVPIVTAPSWQATEALNVPRSTEAQVWAFIESELQAAITLLPATHPGLLARTRADRWAARALLARAHLYQREWQQAYDHADAVIESGRYSLPDSYAEVFNRGFTAEAILELPFSVNDPNALAFWFFTRGLGGRRGFAPTAGFHGSFHHADTRLPVAVGIQAGLRYGRKYTDVQNGTDNVIVLRLAEMYLIRSEAAARLGMLEEAMDDINLLRARAGAGVPLRPINPVTGVVEPITQENLLWWNVQERRWELFYEGHRFFDLRRNMDVPQVAAIMNGLGLTGHRLLFPIPQREIDANTALQGNQNPGY